MALDPYASCPCGSGKKFKWCCQPIHIELEKAFEQDQSGQHEMALKTLDDITQQHPGNPEVWGRRAQVLFGQGKIEEAEASLQKAFEINPNYGFGFLLRGMMREAEGEMAGALILFRKAIDVYDPQAVGILAQLNSFVAECELKLNRPVAARAALERACNLIPQHEQLRNNFEQVFGDKGGLPFAARRSYSFQRPQTEAQRIAWDGALRGKNDSNLREAVQVFESLTTRDDKDLAAWYNLGLCRAWLGDNRGALDAFDRYLALETDDAKGEGAAALCEVLRTGHGMTEMANYVDHSVVFHLRDFRTAIQYVQDWAREGGLIMLSASDPQSPMLMLTGVLVEQRAFVTAPSPMDIRGIGAYFTILNDRLRVSFTDTEKLNRVVDEVKKRFGPSASEEGRDSFPAGFAEVLGESAALAPSGGQAGDELLKTRIAEHIGKYFEEKWIHKPLKSLNGAPPIDAAGHPQLRKKVLGAIRYLQDCGARQQADLYDFDRLRRKLGLLPDKANVAKSAAGLDISAMGAPELAGLATADLDVAQLEQAFQAAIKLDARDLAGKFAEAIVALPASSDKSDRYPWHNHLIQLAVENKDLDTALDRVNAGEKDDCEHNEGRRRNDYELRRAQIHAKRGYVSEAADVFERLVARAPEPRFLGSATEAMLSARDGKRALQFAEDGLKAARERNDRDTEQYFLELQSAAKKLMS